MYEKAVDEGALKAFGLTADDYAHEEVTIWHENAPSYFVFNAMATQWRAGMSGATGLDYNVLPEVWRRLKVSMIERDHIFANLQVMELAALKQMEKNKAD